MSLVKRILFSPRNTQKTDTAYGRSSPSILADIAVPFQDFDIQTAMKQAAMDYAMTYAMKNDGQQKPAEALYFWQFIAGVIPNISWRYGFEILDKTMFYRILEYDDGVIVTAEEMEYLRKCAPNVPVCIPPKSSILS